MTLSFQPYPYDVGNLGEWLVDALPVVEEQTPLRSLVMGDQLELIGPFPAYYLDARDFLTGELDRSTRTGWRALVLAFESPAAVVDITVSDAGEPRFAARGKNAAIALEQALDLVGALDLKGDYEVRWLSMADIYVTAVWLSGARNRFVPTRMGGAVRVDRQLMSQRQLRTIVARLVKLSSSTQSAARSTKGRDAAPSSPRSGLPDE